MGELDLAVTGGRGMEKTCVIKRVLPHLLKADNVQRFREEAMVVVRLSHGNLVGVLDAGREQGEFYLAMDFVEGKDLLATWNQCATRRVAFPVEIAVYIIKELARGLGYAHAFRDLKLVHRDVSPANVLLSYSGEVKLTDFGLATSTLKEQRTAPGIIYGKLAYLAPEQARGQPLDGRTDLYAAGILLWEMLTGAQLFPGKQPGASPSSDNPDSRHSTLDALEKVRHPHVQPPSSLTSRVPPELDAIVMRALAAEPGDRYQNGEALRAELASFLAKFAPATDAATLAAFMGLLFQDEIDRERSERDGLMRSAGELIDAPRGAGGTARGRAPGPGVQARAGDGARQAQPDGVAVGRDRRDPTQPSDRRSAVPAPRIVPDRDPTRAADRADDAVASTGPVSAALSATGSAAGVVDADDARVPARMPETFSDPITGQIARDADEDPRVGTTIGGRYYLRRLCGEGAMGRVYEGHHVEIGRRVAVKILHSNFRNTPDVVERFRREARAASRIGHPNIVDVTDSGTTPDGAFFFVMEYLDGVDLEQLLARGGGLPIERALLIAAQVCRALVGAHTAGIIHRDLKPANIMLVRARDEEDFVKVLDFGISKQSEIDIDPRGKAVGLTHPDAAVGTPIYMAPEQVAGYPADARTDVYAVGELLFEMLTGTAPCGGSDVIAVFNRKANEDPPPARTLRPELSVEIEAMLIRAMARRPADRHQTMAELKDEIMGCLTRTAEAPTPPGSPQRMGNSDTTATARVDRANVGPLWIAGIAAVVALAVAAVTIPWRSEPSRADRARTDRAQADRARLDRATASKSQPPSRDPGATTASKTGALPSAAASPAPPAAAPSPPVVAANSAPPVIAASPTVEPARRPAPLTTLSIKTGPKASAVRGPGTPNRGASAPPPVKVAAVGKGQPATSSADLLRRGRAAFAKGNFPEAVRLGRAVIGTGDAVGGNLLLGDSFYKMERQTDAVAAYEAALKVAPGSPQAQRGRELALRRARP
jgi:serine/threonine protein kinase